MRVAVRGKMGDVERERKDEGVRHHHHVRQEEVPRKATDVHMPRSCHDQISGCVLGTLELSRPNPRKLGGARLLTLGLSGCYIQHRPHIRGLVLDERKEETRIPRLFRIARFRTCYLHLGRLGGNERQHYTGRHHVTFRRTI